jgi:hypothetical protein
MMKVLEILYKNILDNYVNGNMSDFKQQINELTPYEVVGLISYVKSGLYGDYLKAHNVITILLMYLKH